MARALFVFALLFGASALACAVCGQGQNDQNQGVYITMTVFMTVTPLVTMGAIGFWVFWRVKHHDDAPPPPPSPPAVEVAAAEQQNASA